jgi:uncharacterized protein
MTEKIDEYIKQQSCANVCCIDEKGLPYCFSCFYTYNLNEKLLYYKSSLDAHHSKIILKNPVIAGTILPDKLNKLQVRGLQFRGIVLQPKHPLAKNASTLYYKKNPIAIAMPGEIWAIQIYNIKFTDTRLGFGKKLTWRREEKEVIL